MRAGILRLNGVERNTVGGVIIVGKDRIATGRCRRGGGAGVVSKRLAGDEVTGRIHVCRIRGDATHGA